MSNDPQWETRIQDATSSIPKEKHPIIIELAGMPRLGKTTFSDSLTDLLKRSGFRVRLSSYATHASPIDERWSFDFSAWTLFSFLKTYLELKHLGTHFIVADRGLFDAITWIRLKKEDGLCDDATLTAMRTTAQLTPWLNSLCVVIAFVGNPEFILNRSQETRIYEGEGLVTTPGNLSRLVSAIRAEADLWNRERGIVEIFDIRDGGLRDVMVKAAEMVVTSLERFSKL